MSSKQNTMDNKQNEQDAQQQQGTTEQNPTLHQPGTRVADYGNVMGGSADGNVEQENVESNKERSGSNDNQTIGNP